MQLKFKSEAHRSAFSLAFKLIERKDRFQHEIEQALEKAGYSQEIRDEVVHWLREQAVLQDQKTMINAVASRSGGRAVGKEKLREELARRGAPEELIDSALGEIDDNQQLEAMLGLLQKRYSEGRDRMRAGRFLAGRGFDEELIEQALAAFFGEEDGL
jgi:regulatory protein